MTALPPYIAPCDLCPQDTLTITDSLRHVYIVTRDGDSAESVPVALTPAKARELAKMIVARADEIDPSGAAPAPAPAPKPKAIAEKKFSNLSAQSQLVYKHMQRAGSISAREAMNDYGITSSTLARRICDIQEEGFNVNRDRRNHPINQRQYTRYSLV